MLDVGETAPDFTLPIIDGNARPFTLSAEIASGPHVVVFFPAAFTGTCSSELRSFNDRYDRFTDVGASVLGISVDSPLVLSEFHQREGFAFPLLSDFDREVVTAYGVTEPFPNWDVDELAGRAVLVLDTDRRVRWRWMGDPGEEPPYDTVLAAVSDLK